MKYKKGSIVEVFVEDGISYHSWRCAEITSANGNNYTVSYDLYPGFTDKEDVEHISGKFIRPCPPLLELSECLVPGAVVELFHCFSWKMAIVLKDCGWEHFIVRLVGSFQEFEVTKSALRVMQSFQNGEWIVINKVRRDTIADFYMKDLCFDTQNNHHFIESQIFASKTLKRPSNGWEINEERPHKFRRMSEKVDDVANINQTNGSSRALTKLQHNNNNNDIDSVSIMSSSGSCSINSYKSYEMCSGSGHDSDAESVCQSGYREEEEDCGQSAANEPQVDEIHKLELDAYRSTMAALHASGPLDWEKESMVTSLRMLLHISNDEHLIMIKTLISAAASSSNTCSSR